jgi:hypothetical protein
LIVQHKLSIWLLPVAAVVDRVETLKVGAVLAVY